MQDIDDAMKQICEEIRVFEGTAERTGEQLELRGLKAHKNGCTSMRDLSANTKSSATATSTSPSATGPTAQPTVSLDNVKWIGLDKAFQPASASRRGRMTSRTSGALSFHARFLSFTSKRALCQTPAVVSSHQRC